MGKFWERDRPHESDRRNSWGKPETKKLGIFTGGGKRLHQTGYDFDPDHRRSSLTPVFLKKPRRRRC